MFIIQLFIVKKNLKQLNDEGLLYFQRIRNNMGKGF